MTEIEELVNDIKSNVKQPTTFQSQNVVSNTIPLNIPQKKASFETFSDERPEMRYKTLNSGLKVSMYDSYIPGTDNMERAAQNQSGFEQAVNGTTKALANLTSVFVGNTAGFVNGIYEGVKQGNFNATFDNDFSRWLDDINTKLNYQLPNYYTKDSQKGGFLGQLWENPTNTVFNDIFNGLSFTLGTIASEALWAYATGGASIPLRAAQWGAKGARVLGMPMANVGRWSKSFLGVEKTAEGLVKMKGLMNLPIQNMVKTGQISMGAAKVAGKAGEILNTARFIATSSGNEAGIEAFHYKKEAEENFYQNFETMYGRQPNETEVAEFKENNENAAVGVFGGNMIILGISNASMFGGLFGIKSPLSLFNKEVNKRVFGAGVTQEAGRYVALTANKYQKAARFLYVPVKNVLMEGVFEEAGQGTVNKIANKWTERKYDPKYINKAVDMWEIGGQALSEQYLTPEGQKDIWIGGIIGVLGGKITGQNSRFSKMDKENRDGTAKALNTIQDLKTTLVEDIAAKRITTVAQQLEAQDRADKHLSRGEVVQAKLAQYDGLLSGMMLAQRYDSTDNLVNTLSLGIDANQEIDQNEKQEFKDALNRLHETYKKAESFASSIVGNQGRIRGTEKTSAQELKDSLTFALVQGHNANQLMQSSFNEMGQYLNDTSTSAMKLQDEINQLDKDSQKDIVKLTNEHSKLKTIQESLMQEAARLNAAPIETTGDKRSGIAQNQQKQEETLRQIQEVEQKLEVYKNQLEQNQKLTTILDNKETNLNALGAFISVEDLLKVESRIKELNKTYSQIEKLNPANAKVLEQLMNQYQTAQRSLLEYNAVASHIVNGKFKPTLANDNMFSRIFGKSKADEETLAFYDALQEIRKREVVKSMEAGQKKDLENYRRELEELESKETLTEEEQTRVETLKNSISALETTPNVLTQDEVKEKIQILEDELSTIQDDNDPRIEEIDNEISELEKLLEIATEVINDDRPKAKEEVKKEPTTKSALEELKERANNIIKNYDTKYVGNDDLNERVKKRPSQTDIERYRELLSNNQTDTEEFEQLQSKMSLWKIYDSISEDYEESLADIFDKIASLETQVEEDETITDAKPEYDNEADLDIEAKTNVTDHSLTNNTNFAPTIKIREKGQIELTHLYPQTIINRMGGTDIELNGKKISTLKDVKLKPEDRVEFIASGVKTLLTAGFAGKLFMSKKDFLNIPGIITSVKVTEKNVNWTYSVLYEQDGNGKVTPLKSDFRDDTVQGHTNDLKNGEEIGLFVDVNNEWTKGLDEKDLEGSIVIYVRKRDKDGKGMNFQTLKAYRKEKKEEITDDTIVRIREAAVKQYKTGKSGYIGTIKIERVELGTPILLLDETGNVITAPITEQGLQNIETTGYIQNGELFLNKDVPDVRKSYVSKSSRNSKNKDKKIPIVVIKQGNQMIAFPITMKKTPDSKLNELMDILNSQAMDDGQKPAKINNLLNENGIPASRFGLTSLSQVEKIEQIKEVLDKVESYTTANDLVQKYDKKRLVNEAEITIDLANLPVHLPSQKLKLDFSSLNLTVEPSLEEVAKETEKEQVEVKNTNVSKTIDKELTTVTFLPTEENIEQIKKDPLLSSLFTKTQLKNLKANKSIKLNLKGEQLILATEVLGATLAGKNTITSKGNLPKAAEITAKNNFTVEPKEVIQAEENVKKVEDKIKGLEDLYKDLMSLPSKYDENFNTLFNTIYIKFKRKVRSLNSNNLYSFRDSIIKLNESIYNIKTKYVDNDEEVRRKEISNFVDYFIGYYDNYVKTFEKYGGDLTSFKIAGKKTAIQSDKNLKDTYDKIRKLEREKETKLKDVNTQNESYKIISTYDKKIEDLKDKLDKSYIDLLKSVNISKEEFESFDTIQIDEENIEDIEKVDNLPSINELEEIAKKMKYNKDNFDLLSDEDMKIWDKSKGEINKIIGDYITEQRKSQPKPTSTPKPKSKDISETLPNYVVDMSEYKKGDTLRLYKKEDGNWYFIDSNKQEQKDTKNREFHDWLHSKIGQGNTLTNQESKTFKEEFKEIQEIKDTNSEIECK